MKIKSETVASVNDCTFPIRSNREVKLTPELKYTTRK